MSKWSTRVAIYKFSLIMAYVVFLVFALAFSVPVWLGYTGLIMGLWAGGPGDSKDFNDVKATGFDKTAFDADSEEKHVWMDVVRGLWLGGMAFYLLGAIVGLVENCFRSSASKDYGVSGFLILLAGVCGAAGVITFAVEVEEDRAYKNADYLWGYILAVIASGLAVILAIVLLISRNYSNSPGNVKDSRTADYVYAHNKHNGHHHQQRPYAPEYNNPGYRGDELPLVNGVPFHQPYGQSPYSMYRTGQENGFSAGNKYDQGSGYYPYGYKEPRAGNRTSIAESADLSNGYTQDIVHAEHSLGRSRDFGGSRSQYNRGEVYYNGGNRPY